MANQSHVVLGIQHVKVLENELYSYSGPCCEEATAGTSKINNLYSEN